MLVNNLKLINTSGQSVYFFLNVCSVLALSFNSEFSHYMFTCERNSDLSSLQSIKNTVLSAMSSYSTGKTKFLSKRIIF